MDNKNSVNLTKSVVDKITPILGKDQVFYRDEHLKGFALRVTLSGMKSFVVETRIEGRVKLMTLGKYGAITVEEARKQAKNLLGQIARGDNPIAEKKSNKIKTITLKEVLNDYLKARKDLKVFTANDYQNVLKQVLLDWLDKPLINITREMIAKRHVEYGTTNSKARANYAMRVLRAVFNFAVYEYQLEDGQPIISINPVEYLSHTRGWFRVDRKNTVIHTLPMSDFLYELFERRKQFQTSEFVFPAPSKTGHIMEPRKAMLKVAELSGVSFTVHDLRRTFATTAESLDLPAYALKRLLNHKMTHDVTVGYIMRDVERLRKPMQMITDFLINKMANSLEAVVDE